MPTPASQPAGEALVAFALHRARITPGVCTLQRRERGFTLERRTVPDENLIFVTRGRPVWVIDDQPLELAPGMLLLVRPGVPHHGYSHTRRITLLSLHGEARLPGGRPVFDLLHAPDVRSVPEDGKLDRILRHAMSFFRGDQPAARYMMHGWVDLALRQMIADDAAAGRLTTTSLDPLVVALLNELEKRIADPVDLQTLARLSGFTPQHLNRVFRAALGVTPLQHLARLRMERASTLLLEGRLTVAAVGRAVGYADPYYFSRVFRQHFGHSPSDHQQAGDSIPPA